MRAIITHHPSCEVTRIDRLGDKTIFHIATGQALRVGIAPTLLETRLNIDLSQPPDKLPTHIFYNPFMSHAVWEVVAPIVRTHPDVQRAFDSHPNLQALVRLSYTELQDLPLRAYITHALYLSHPFSFSCPVTDPHHLSTDYSCSFIDGDYVVRVVVDLRSRAVTVTSESTT